MAHARIEIERVQDDTFRVTITEGASHTAHTVTVDAADYQKLTGGTATKEELVRRSFEFLLERESKESILSSFSLAVISRYFPEYGREISRRMRGD